MANKRKIKLPAKKSSLLRQTKRRLDYLKQQPGSFGYIPKYSQD